MRWEKGTRYYEAEVLEDLLGDLTVIKRWGRKGSALGGMKQLPVSDRGAAARELLLIRKKRKWRGYKPRKTGT